MFRLDHNRRQKGLLLLALHVAMLIVGALHSHECDEDAFVCQDCLAHVMHNAHVSKASAPDSDCLLCKLLHSTYIAPEAIILSAVVLLVATLAMPMHKGAVGRSVALPSLRAPPFALA